MRYSLNHQKGQGWLHPKFFQVYSDSAILGGVAVITGTRIPVALLLGHLASGMSLDEIADEYDLVKENIYSALAYAAKRIEEDRITHP